MTLAVLQNEPARIFGGTARLFRSVPVAVSTRTPRSKIESLGLTLPRVQTLDVTVPLTPTVPVTDDAASHEDAPTTPAASMPAAIQALPIFICEPRTTFTN